METKTTNPFEIACKNKIVIDLPKTIYNNGTRHFDIKECIGTVNPITIWNLKKDKLQSIYDLYTNRLDKLTTPKKSLFGDTPNDNPKKVEYETILAIIETVAKHKIDEKIKIDKRIKDEKRLNDLIYALKNAEREKLLNMNAKEIKKEIKALKKTLGK